MNCYSCNSKKLEYVKETDSYVCRNCGYVYPKQYFFISHSHIDIEKVRIIRNTIEETFFYEPILFFLKCLSDEHEINDLLRREIYERIWFVYCKSRNAERSRYVQQEVEYMNKLRANGKKYHYVEIDLDKYPTWDARCTNYIRAQIRPVIKRSKIFLSYSMHDTPTAERLRDALTKNGLTVWEPRSMTIKETLANQIADRIKEHSYKNAVFLFLLSPHSAASRSCINELDAAQKCNATVLPVLIDDGAEVSTIPQIATLQALKISAIPPKAEIEQLLQIIDRL